MYQEFTLASLTEFSDGKVAASFNRFIKQATADCMDRPGEKGARTVELQIEVKPVTGDEGMCESVQIMAKIIGKAPKYHSAPVNCTAHKNGQTFFNDMAPDDASQTTIDEA